MAISTAIHPAIGTSPEELASHPALLLDLALSLQPKRLKLATGLLALLGGNSREKVRNLLDDLEAKVANPPEHASVLERFRAARDIHAATCRLESSIWTLVLGRIRQGFGVMGRVPRLDKLTDTDLDLEADDAEADAEELAAV